MPTAPIVSIIVPTYNDIAVVCDAIDCAVNQSYPHTETIVVDDGSHDNTGVMLQQRYGSTITYLRQDNRGLSSARNLGIRHASGRYLQFLDADDLISLDKVAVQVEQLRSGPGPAVAYCDYVRTDLNDRERQHTRVSPVLSPDDPFHDLMTKWETELSIPPHCFLFDAALFKDRGIYFDEELPTHEDWECWMRIFACRPTLVFTDRVLANYRVREASMCTNHLSMRRGYLLAIDKRIRAHRDSRQIVAHLTRRRRQIEYVYRDTSPLMRLLTFVHPRVARLFRDLVPWRLQRWFD